MSIKQKILLGIAGGIAAYKTPDLIRQLIAANSDVKVAITKNALEFVSRLTLQTLLPDRIFETLLEPSMQHIQLAKWADIILIAPATANTIAKIANGSADDLLSTICLATTAPLFIAPAMNQTMWHHAATQKNIEILMQRGAKILGPAHGEQACGNIGMGRMLEPSDILLELEKSIIKPFLKDIRILISAGATREYIDPVRFISNRSSGKMGFAIADAAFSANAFVTVIAGETSVVKPACHQFIKVTSAKEMQDALELQAPRHDIFIGVAAVSDFTVKNSSYEKIKRDDKLLTLELIATADIIKSVRDKNKKLFIVAFAAETNHVLENAKQKRIRKNSNMIVANDVSKNNIGFEADENAVTVISEKNIIHLEKNSKKIIAMQLLKIINENFFASKI